MKFLWVRGAKTTETNVKLLKSSTVYFQQKFAMTTTLDKEAFTDKYTPKESKLRLMKVYTKDELEFVGEAIMDLAQFVTCQQRT